MQYIVVDGGSTDGTLSILNKYSSYIDIIISEPDNGQSHAISKGLQLCDGYIFNWLNSDDTYALNALKTVGQCFSDPTINVLCGHSHVYGQGQDYVSSGTDIYPNSIEKTIGCARIDQPETFFKLECIRNIGSIDQSLDYIFDRELWIRYLFHYQLQGVKQIDCTLVNFRLHLSSKTVSSQSLFQQEGSILEENLLFKYPLRKKKTLPLLVAAIENVADPNYLKKVSKYYLMHQFSMAYASRDITRMIRYEYLLAFNGGTRFQAVKRANLYLRILLLALVNPFVRITKLV